MCNMAVKVKKKLRQTPKYILKKIANISAIVIHVYCYLCYLRATLVKFLQVRSTVLVTMDTRFLNEHYRKSSCISAKSTKLFKICRFMIIPLNSELVLETQFVKKILEYIIKNSNVSQYIL